jgi:hypothetical protein
MVACISAPDVVARRVATTTGRGCAVRSVLLEPEHSERRGSSFISNLDQPYSPHAVPASVGDSRSYLRSQLRRGCAINTRLVRRNT